MRLAGICGEGESSAGTDGGAYCRARGGVSVGEAAGGEERICSLHTMGARESMWVSS